MDMSLLSSLGLTDRQLATFEDFFDRRFWLSVAPGRGRTNDLRSDHQLSITVDDPRLSPDILLCFRVMDRDYKRIACPGSLPNYVLPVRKADRGFGAVERVRGADHVWPALERQRRAVMFDGQFPNMLLRI